jgi:hypothetical protein
MPAVVTNILHYPIFLIVVLGLIVWLYWRGTKASRSKRNSESALDK